jgi:hypothetical protein
MPYKEGCVNNVEYPKTTIFELTTLLKQRACIEELEKKYAVHGPCPARSPNNKKFEYHPAPQRKYP